MDLWRPQWPHHEFAFPFVEKIHDGSSEWGKINGHKLWASELEMYICKCRWKSNFIHSSTAWPRQKKIPRHRLYYTLIAGEYHRHQTALGEEAPWDDPGDLLQHAAEPRADLGHLRGLHDRVYIDNFNPQGLQVQVQPVSLPKMSSRSLSRFWVGKSEENFFSCMRRWNTQFDAHSSCDVMSNSWMRVFFSHVSIVI